MRRLGYLILTLLLSYLAAAQGDEFGYIEGRIIAINEARNVAIVALPDRTVEAQLGSGFFMDQGRPLPEFRKGQRVELYYAPGPDGQRQYYVADWVRHPALIWLLGLFVLVAVAVARGRGLRAVFATSASLAVVIAFIVPGILAGHNPLLISLVGAGGILIMAIYFVHGVNWSTTAALAGTFIAVVITMGLGIAFSDLAHLTGVGDDKAMFIGFGAPQVALKGLLLAGLVIGALGALVDITIVQASVVRELAYANPNFGLRELYQRAMKVGLDHIGSLIDTLVLAYTGAALPLLLLLHLGEAVTPLRALNLELVATEVVRILVGSIGLILAVPLTTLLAALLLRGDRLSGKPELEHNQH